MKKQEKNNTSIYVFDLEKIMDFVFDNGNAANKRTEINEFYDYNSDNKNKTGLSSKSVNEVKEFGNPQNDAIRYDFVKLLIGSLTELPSDFSNTEMTFGDKLIINTLFNEEFIKAIEE